MFGPVGAFADSGSQVLPHARKGDGGPQGSL